jgi:hypothetical protein
VSLILALLSLIPVVRAEPFVADIFPLDAPTQKLYGLTRTEKKESGTKESFVGSIKDLAGNEVFRDETVLDSGKVVRFSLDHKVMGESGFAELKEGRIFYSYTKNGKTETSDEKAPEQVIVAGTVVSFLQENWERLLAGETVSTRMIVVDRQETVGFSFKKTEEKTDAGRALVVVKMAPTSPFIKMLVKDMFFMFDKATRRVTTYSGRISAKRKVDDSWKDLDARLDYKYN